MSDNSATRRAALWVGAVFLLGAALGGVLGYVFAHRSYAASTAAPQSDDARRAQRVGRLTKNLNLNAEQQKQLDAIMAQVQGQFNSLHQQTDPQYDQVRQKGREQIRAILLPEQKPKFEEFLKHLDEERKRNPPR